MISSDTGSSSLVNLWKSFEEPEEGSTTFCESSFSKSAACVNWMIENRGGIAKITGTLILPSQFIGPDSVESAKIIDAICEKGVCKNCRIEKIQIVQDEELLDAIICTPFKWDAKNTSKSVLYHNPNGITIAGYFEENKLTYTPGKLLELYHCPIILYDYRGTGINQDKGLLSSSKCQATYETIVEDGLAALNFTAKTYEKVEVWGSSLGGGVATVSLERYLTQNPEEKNRFTLTNHDSFTKTARVVIPSYPVMADFIGFMVGGNLDAETSMKSLIEKNIKVTVLCHGADPVIPEGARMAEFVSSLGEKGNVSLHISPLYGHADLSHDLYYELENTGKRTEIK